MFALSLNIPVSIADEMVSVAMNVLSKWLAVGTGELLLDLAKALSSTTTVHFGAGFTTEFEMIAELGAVLSLPLLVLSAIQAVLRQDLSGLVRMVFVRVPVALVMSGVVVAVVQLALSATDELSAGLLGLGGSPTEGYLQQMSAGFLVLGTPSQVAQALVCALAALVTFVLWLELAVRSAAVAVATLFTPLALCGLVWPATAHWARRLGETLGALIFAKPVIAAVLALSVDSIFGGGLDGLVQGVALLLLASLAPFALLKLVPFVEQGAASHLGGMGQRAGGAAYDRGVGGYDSLADLFAANDEGPRPVPVNPGTPFGAGENFAQIYADTAAEIAGFAASSSEAEPGGGEDDLAETERA